MKFKNLLTNTVVLGVILLFAGTGFGEGDGKVSIDQWIKIIEAKGDKKAPSPENKPETKKNQDSVNHPPVNETAGKSPNKVKYDDGNFPGDIDWTRKPSLTRMIPQNTVDTPMRITLKMLSAADQTKELNKCIRNVVLLVHGHNETEGKGSDLVRADVNTVGTPWFIDYKRDVWTNFYDQYNNDYNFSLNDKCTVFYEFIYPTYRPIFTGNGNLGCDLAQLLAKELQPLIDKKTDFNLFIVAHSMGGLVARAAIQNFSPELHTAFQKLVTWGTPHHGAALGSLRYAFAGPYKRIPISPVSTLVNLSPTKYMAVIQQLDTPGARDLRWDNFSPLALDESFEIPPEANLDAKVYNVGDGSWLYNKNLQILNSSDIYRGPSAPKNRLYKKKYAFLYGITSKHALRAALMPLCTESICLGASFTNSIIPNASIEYFPGATRGSSDGAVPVASMTAEGVEGDVVPVGDIDHEEYFGAPLAGSPGKFTKATLAADVAKQTFTALQLSDFQYSCPKPEIKSISPNPAKPGDTIAISGASFCCDDPANKLNLSMTSLKWDSWTDAGVIFVLPESQKTGGKVKINVGGRDSNEVDLAVLDNEPPKMEKEKAPAGRYLWSCRKGIQAMCICMPAGEWKSLGCGPGDKSGLCRRNGTPCP